MSILNYNTTLQSNNTDLQAILDAVNELPEAVGYKEVEWSENEDAVISRTISNYTNDRILYVGANAFNSCSSLTTVSFPACTRIGMYAFNNCSSLTSVSFPACTGIYYGAFQYCSSLTTVNFPACTTIHSSAFYGCSSITSANFPACTFIDVNAFRYCYNLKSLYLTGSSLCTLLNSYAFTSTPIGGYSASAGTYGSIYVPASLLTSYQTATNWTYFSSRFVAFDGGNNLITFTIEGIDDCIEYQAEEGMTLREWVESEYNTDGYYIDDETVYFRNGSNLYGLLRYNLDDLILSNKNYILEGMVGDSDEEGI